MARHISCFAPDSPIRASAPALPRRPRVEAFWLPRPLRGDGKAPSGCSVSRRIPAADAALGDFSAAGFSTRRWEPSFHRGLVGPSLRSVLRRGIAYPWGLRAASLGPGNSRILTSGPVSRLRWVATAPSGIPGTEMSPTRRGLLSWIAGTAPACTPPGSSTCARPSPRWCAPASAWRGWAWFPPRAVVRSRRRGDPCRAG